MKMESLEFFNTAPDSPSRLSSYAAATASPTKIRVVRTPRASSQPSRTKTTVIAADVVEQVQSDASLDLKEFDQRLQIRAADLQARRAEIAEATVGQLTIELAAARREHDKETKQLRLKIVELNKQLDALQKDYAAYQKNPRHGSAVLGKSLRQDDVASLDPEEIISIKNAYPSDDDTESNYSFGDAELSLERHPWGNYLMSRLCGNPKPELSCRPFPPPPVKYDSFL